MGHFNEGYRPQGVGSMSEHYNEDDLYDQYLTLSPGMDSLNGEVPTGEEILMEDFGDPSQQHIEPAICK